MSSPKTTICGYARSASARVALMVWASVSGPAYSGSRPLKTAIRVGCDGIGSGSGWGGSPNGSDSTSAAGSSSVDSAASTDSVDSPASEGSAGSAVSSGVDDGDGHSSSSSAWAGGGGGSAPTANSSSTGAYPGPWAIWSSSRPAASVTARDPRTGRRGASVDVMSGREA